MSLEPQALALLQQPYHSRNLPSVTACPAPSSSGAGRDTQAGSEFPSRAGGEGGLWGDCCFLHVESGGEGLPSPREKGCL